MSNLSNNSVETVNAATTAIVTAESRVQPTSVQGPESEELAEASKMEDDVKFYQTTSPNVAKLFHMDTQEKRPALVMIEESEKINHFGLILTC